MPERAIHHQRLGRHLGFEALRQHHLIDIARRDVVLRGSDLFLEALARVVGSHVEAVLPAGTPVRQVALELALEKLNFGARELVQRLEILVRGDPRVRDDENPVTNVIERQYGIEHHEAGLVCAIGSGAEISQHRLEP